MGKNVTSIGDWAFRDCLLLTSIDIPSSVTNIGELAFAGTSISYIDIPNGVTNIGYGAFQKSSLISIVIPDSVIDIGESTFKGCRRLARVYCKAAVPPVGYEMFDSGVHVYVPYQSVEAYKTNDSWKKYANYIVGYDYEQNAEVDLDLSKCEVGDFIVYKGVKCVVFYAEEDAVKLVSASSYSCEWGLMGQSVGAYNEDDGSVNAAKAKSKGLFDSLPAFAWCESLGDGWYLPSHKELWLICNCKGRINNALSLYVSRFYNIGGKKYWSSTENGSSYAYSLFIEKDGTPENYSITSKNAICSVRAVMTIKK
jgi:hypothetical protein